MWLFFINFFIYIGRDLFPTESSGVWSSSDERIKQNCIIYLFIYFLVYLFIYLFT